MNEIEKPSSDSREILRLLKTYEASNEAYYLSFDPELDGRTVPFLCRTLYRQRKHSIN